MQMKHDLQAFSREIVALIKTSGDIGGSGDKRKNSLQHNDSSVPTREAVASPLKNEWGQHAPSSGDRKTKQFESVRQGVPNVPTATAHFEEGRAARTFEDNPAGWHAISEELKQMPAPEWVGVNRWFEMIEDADAFLSSWGSAAHDLGWTALHLFGVHAVAPGSRYDVMGLVPLLRGGRVSALTEQTAVIRQRSGATLIYTRAKTCAAVLPCARRNEIA
jgi:hypothetical protein